MYTNISTALPWSHSLFHQCLRVVCRSTAREWLSGIVEWSARDWETYEQTFWVPLAHRAPAVLSRLWSFGWWYRAVQADQTSVITNILALVCKLELCRIPCYFDAVAIIRLSAILWHTNCISCVDYVGYSSGTGRIELKHVRKIAICLNCACTCMYIQCISQNRAT